MPHDYGMPLRRYQELLVATHCWFERVLQEQKARMRCAKGCTLCCHGLFDVSLPDALMLAGAFAELPVEVRTEAHNRAAEIQALIQRNAPEIAHPFLLSQLGEERIDEIVVEAGSPRCPLLNDRGECVVYDRRPLACRIEGAPMIDLQDGLFGDWCELNFDNGVPPEARSLLALDYYEIQQVEESCTEALSPAVLGRRCPRATTFIPSIIVAFDSFWLSALRRPAAAPNPSAHTMTA